mmetsp:Transcript_4224/g.13194  ORF Transcript_4224/g.13194 Transcript_4224/m.13194 type:complete len:107 (+) Transcript_4224:1338-1658(+)
MLSKALTELLDHPVSSCEATRLVAAIQHFLDKYRRMSMLFNHAGGCWYNIFAQGLSRREEIKPQIRRVSVWVRLYGIFNHANVKWDRDPIHRNKDGLGFHVNINLI